MIKTRAIIDTQALKNNLLLAHQTAPGCLLMAVVKADAYGHGATELLPVLQHHADGLAVARLEEAAELRQAGFRGRLLLLAGVSTTAELQEANSMSVDLVIHDAFHLDLLAAYKPIAGNMHFWLKMDTGMHRLGFAPEEYSRAFTKLTELPWCESVTGMTHFASADEPGNPKTAQQLTAFQQHSEGLALASTSLANSGGLLAWPAARTGWLRPGLMLYGVNPLDDKKFPLPLKPVMQLEAQVISTRTIDAGETVGYNETWRAERTTQLAFVSAGYADGYPITVRKPLHENPSQVPGSAAINSVAFNNERLPIVGRISMDTIAIDCTGATTPSVGDWVELWGNTIPVKEVATNAGTIPYQLLTNVSSRVTRIYR